MFKLSLVSLFCSITVVLGQQPKPKSKPPGGGGGGPPGGGGGGPGGAAGGCTNTPCTTRPCAASCLNDVGLTTASGTDPSGTATSKTDLAVGENIYGPFEAGFSSMQDNILSGLGCTTGKGYVAGGIDTNTAEEVVAKDCNVVLPRTENGNYISLLRQCGGHTKEYHFHERLNCLYNEAAAGHSTQVGKEKLPPSSTNSDELLLYGKYETTGTIPTDLDACGAHFGTTPDSNGNTVYHYHVQDKAPFTFGCFGPDKDGSGNAIAVTFEKCRSLYPTCNDACQIVELDIKNNRHINGMPGGKHLYNKWCPCYDSNGKNVPTGTTTLPDKSNENCITVNASSGGIERFGSTSSSSFISGVVLLMVVNMM